MHFIVSASPHKPLDVTLQVHRSHDVEDDYEEIHLQLNALFDL